MNMTEEQAAQMMRGLALLRQPFPPHQISKLPKPTRRDAPKGKCAECGGWHGLPAIHLDYVGHAALTDRLLDADPAWSWEPLSMGDGGLPVMDSMGGMWIRLTVCGVTRLGYGHAGDKTGGDAIKEVIGDALRNAAMRFGAALDLWHKGDLHIDDEPRKLIQESGSTMSAGPIKAPLSAREAAMGDVFRAMSPELQTSIRRATEEAVKHVKGGDLKSAIAALHSNIADWSDPAGADIDANDMKLAQWYLLDSGTRSAIKAREKETA